MNSKQQIDNLWREFRTSVNRAYADSQTLNNDDRASLRDYAEDISMPDAMAELLGRETANERRHRANRPSVPGFSNESASKLILMHQAADGAISKKMPKATEFLMYRQTAIEARTIGFLAKGFISPTWIKNVYDDSLDYSKLMGTKT